MDVPPSIPHRITSQLILTKIFGPFIVWWPGCGKLSRYESICLDCCCSIDFPACAAAGGADARCGNNTCPADWNSSNRIRGDSGDDDGAAQGLCAADCVVAGGRSAGAWDE